MTTPRKLNGHKPIPIILTVLALLLLLSGFLSPGVQGVAAAVAAAQQPIVATAVAPAFADPAFQKLWNRTDQQVASGAASRTFLWGPSPNTQGIVEDYQESPNGGKRLVQYFDKSRMEITNPGGDQTSQYFVSNGLLAKELMTGQMQLGDNKFETHDAANIGVAGDQDDTTGPTYAALERTDKPAATDDTGILVGATIDRAGNVSFDNPGDLGKKWQVSNAFYESATKHNIAGPFWTFLNQTGQVQTVQGSAITGRLFDPVYYATGLPITEAYWAQVKVAGVTKDVLVQAFERRVLTFTPTNSPAFQVEMGNVGQHYYRWRYTDSNLQPVYAAPSSPPATSTPLPLPAPTSTPKPGGGGNLPAANCLPATANVAGNLVQACVTNASPDKNTNVTVYGRLVVGGQPVNGAAMDTTWNYKTTTSYCSGTTGSDGVASCTRDISRASSGYTVYIDVSFSYGGQTYSGQTSFTPQ